MIGRTVILSLGLLVPLAAQQAAQVPRLGYLSASAPQIFRVDVFRHALRALGWVEGQNLRMEYRSADGHLDRLPALAAALVERKVQVIVAAATVPALAAQRATQTIPIVFTHVSDPIGSGLVPSLAQPGGNITGLTHLKTGLSPKRLEYLKEALPHGTHVVALWHPGGLGERTDRDLRQETEDAARALGVPLHFLAVRGPDDVDEVFATAAREGAGALLVLPGPMLLTAHRRLAALAAQYHLPAVYFAREFAEAGGLMAYGANMADVVRRAASHVDKILKGTKPGDLPVERAMRFELVLNLKTAKALGLLVAPLMAEAQQAPHGWRVAFLGAESPVTSGHFLDAFRQGLRDLGYVEDQTITIEARWAEGRHERFPSLVAELVRLNVHVMLAISTPAALAAQQGTPTTPVVFIAGEPLGSGLVASLAQPGGNLTGMSLALGEEFAGKWLELLQEAMPHASPVALLWNPANPANAGYVKTLQGAAQRLGVTLHPQEVQDARQFASAFATMATARAQALIVFPDPLTVRYRGQIVALAAQHRLPAMDGLREFVHAGGLRAYGANVSLMCRRAAVYVDKLLKGIKPGDLPVEQATTFELVINLKTAKALGLTIPPTHLVQADEVRQ